MRTLALLVALATLTQQLPVRDVARTDAPTATIRGRVIDDVGQPVNRAVVVVVGAPPGGARTAIADQHGRYTIERLPAARVRLTASRPPYPRAAYGQLMPTDPGTEIALRAGETFDATIVMPRGAVITGTVHDSRGRPVPNLSVLVSLASESTTRPMLGVASATTDVNGRFRAWGLTAGDYVVAARHPAFLTRPGSDATPPLRLRAGEEREIVLRLREDDEPLARVEAHVLTPDGNFIPATSLELINLDAKSMAANGQVNPNGTFTMAAVPRGRYRAIARALRYSETSAPATGRVTTTFWGITDFTVDGEDMVIAIRLAPGVSVSGRVVTKGTAALEPNKIYIQLDGAGDFVGGFGGVGTAPQPDGTFALAGVAPGTYTIAVSATTASPDLTIASAMIGEVDALDAPIVVPAEGLTGLVVTLTDRPTALTGALRDADGRPATSAGLLLYPRDERFWFPRSRRVVLVRPDSEGRLSARGLPEGTYHAAVVTSLPAAWQDPVFLRTVTPTGAITLRAGVPVEQDFVVRTP